MCPHVQGGLPLNTAMPVAFDALHAPLAHAAAAAAARDEEDDTFGFGDFVSGNVSAARAGDTPARHPRAPP